MLKVVIVSSLVALIFAGQSKTGMKMRVTKKALEELVRAENEMMENAWEKAKAMFKKKMSFIAKQWPTEATGIFEDPTIKDIELISFNKGTGKNTEFQAPNKLQSSVADMGFKFKVTIEDGGKTGTITVEVKDLDSTVAFGFTMGDTGNFQLSKEACSLTAGTVTAVFKGFGPDKDKKYNKLASTKIAQLKGSVGQMMCAQLEMVLAMGNMALANFDCEMKLINNTAVLFSMCLVKDPVATSDYMDFSFSGETSHVSQTRGIVPGGPSTYSPEPLQMTDDGLSKMIYFWEAQAMHNTFFKVLHDHEYLQMHVCKDSKPDVNNRLKKVINKVRKELGKPEIQEPWVLKTSIKTAAAPEVEFSADSPNAIKGKLKLEITHRIKPCGEHMRCAEELKRMVASLEGKMTFDVTQAEEGKVFPKFTAKVTVEKLKFEEMEPAEQIPASLKAKFQKRAKIGLEKMLNKILKEFTDKHYEAEDKWLPPYMKVMQVTNFHMQLLDKSSEFGTNVKFDLEKIAELTTPQ